MSQNLEKSGGGSHVALNSCRLSCMKVQILSARCARALTFIGLSATAASAFATDAFVVRDIRLEGLQRTEPNTVFSY
ncbi:hypothetical protein, partial [Paraburkholderia sp.]|uniref:hypothetical protein n=1 Tax=Paraburkholderia sp. TaxID=1926495 RepID=UPI002F3ED834